MEAMEERKENKFPRVLQLLWNMAIALLSVGLKDQDMKAEGGARSNKGGGKGPKGQGVQNNGLWKGGSAGWELKSGAAWKGGEGKGCTGEGGTYCLDGVSSQGVSQDGGGAWQAAPSNPRTPKLFLMEDKLPGLELRNRLVPWVRQTRTKKFLWCFLKTFFRCFVSSSASSRLWPKVKHARKRRGNRGSAEKI